MFLGCISLEELNLSNFNIENVLDKSSMFKGCSDILKNSIRIQKPNIGDEAFN